MLRPVEMIPLYPFFFSSTGPNLGSRNVPDGVPSGSRQHSGKRRNDQVPLRIFGSAVVEADSLHDGQVLFLREGMIVRSTYAVRWNLYRFITACGGWGYPLPAVACALVDVWIGLVTRGSHAYLYASIRLLFSFLSYFQPTPFF